LHDGGRRFVVRSSLTGARLTALRAVTSVYPSGKSRPSIGEGKTVVAGIRCEGHSGASMAKDTEHFVLTNGENVLK